MRSLLILSLLLGGLARNSTAAQSEMPGGRETAAESVAGGTAMNSDDVETSAREEQQRKQKIEIGLILTSGIVIVGVFLVVVTLLYGRRTKRQIASGRGPSSPRDDLWYLKKSPEAPSADVSDAEQEGTSE